MTWKPVRSVFTGGTDDIRKLFGKRVKVARTLSGFKDGQGGQVDLKLDEVGFVGYPVSSSLDEVILAFPAVGPLPASIDALMRKGTMKTVVVNWPNFKNDFFIDI